MPAEPTLSAASPYRGEDRRRVAAPTTTRWGVDWWVAVGLFVVTIAAVSALATDPAPLSIQVPLLRALLLMLAVLLATASAVITFAVWRLNGEAPALYAGTAFLTYGVVALGVGKLTPLIAPGTAAAIRPEALFGAAHVVGLVLFLRALTVPTVDARVRGTTLVAAALGAVTALTIVLRLSPRLAELVAGGANAVAMDVPPSGLTSVLLLGVAVVSVLKARGGQRALCGWLALTFLMMLASRIVIEATPTGPLMQGFWWAVLRAVALGFAFWGSARELKRVYAEASSRVARSEYRASTVAERIRNEHAAQEERAHEARSALAAIEGATKTLEHYRDRLPQATQQTLMAGVVEEIRRLQRLVSLPAFVDESEPFDIAETVMPLIELERARGTQVDVEIPPGATAMGRAADTVQVLQAFLDNARRYARTPVLVDVLASATGDEWHIRVHDRGPGIPPEERDVIFQRGRRGSTAIATDGTGLGLAIATQLAEGQEGRLFVQERVGGGSVFVLVLPVANRPQAQRRDDASHVTQ